MCLIKGQVRSRVCLIKGHVGRYGVRGMVCLI